MQLPVRVSLLLNPTVSIGILLATGFSTLVFVSTPFLFPLISDHYDIGLGLTSFVGTFQLGGFVIGSWGAGRHLSPTRRVFFIALLLAVVANLASSLLPAYPILIGLRFLSGISMGMISWFGWVQVFGDEARMGEIAVVGPIVGVLTSPLIALVATRGGASSIFLFLGLLAIGPLIFNRTTGVADPPRPTTERHQAVFIARILLLFLGLFTLGGSSVFTYAVVIGAQRLDLSASQVAWVFSLNALCSTLSAGRTGKRGIPGPWLMSAGVMAILLATASSTWVFAAAAAWWGFAFWMGVPGVFTILAERSEYPQERAGDAQAVMAIGRVFGPLLGGLVLQTSGSTLLGWIGGSIMISMGIAIFSTRNLTDPTDTLDGIEPASV